MLRSLREFIGYELKNTDGPKGETVDFLFDDRSWKIKYLEADLGKFLPGKKVLIAPDHLENPDRDTARIGTDLEITQISNAKPLADDRPVSQQWEERLSEVSTPSPSNDGSAQVFWLGRPYPANFDYSTLKNRSETFDYHLRSFQEVRNYKVEASDRVFGRLEDIIVDTNSWTVQHFVFSTHRWFPSQKILVPAHMIDEFDWMRKRVRISRSSSDLKQEKTFDPKEPVNPGRKDEEFFDFYGRRHLKPELQCPVLHNNS